jgi:hypothetical protein
MSEKKDEMGAVTHQLSQVDDDTNKHKNVKEAHVASVALGKLCNIATCQKINDADTNQPPLSRLRSPSCFLRA